MLTDNELDVRDLTTGEAAGAGLYDELMRTSQSHIKKEFDAGRIAGSDYAQVYLGAMQSNLQNSVQYLLQYLTVNKQLELMGWQINQAKKQNDLLDLQREQLRIANDTALYNLNNMMPEQLTQLLNQNALLVEQRNQVLGQIAYQAAQTKMVGKQEELVDSQIRDAQDKYTNPTGGLNKAAYDKLMREMELMNQKIITEKSQTQSDVNGVPIGGLVGREINLKTKQADSFDRNAEVQATKILTDSFAVLYSTEPENTKPVDFGIIGSNTSTLIDKLIAGVAPKGM